MADFHQEGTFTTLHGLYEVFDREEYLNRLEKKLVQYARHVKIGLLLPSLYSEIKVPDVLERILGEIEKVRYIHTVVVALGGASEEAQFREAEEYFGRLKMRGRDVKVVWVEGPDKPRYRSHSRPDSESRRPRKRPHRSPCAGSWHRPRHSRGPGH